MGMFGLAIFLKINKIKIDIRGIQSCRNFRQFTIKNKLKIERSEPYKNCACAKIICHQSCQRLRTLTQDHHHGFR